MNCLLGISNKIEHLLLKSRLHCNFLLPRHSFWPQLPFLWVYFQGVDAVRHRFQTSHFSRARWFWFAYKRDFILEVRYKNKIFDALKWHCAIINDFCDIRFVRMHVEKPCRQLIFRCRRQTRLTCDVHKLRQRRRRFIGHSWTPTSTYWGGHTPTSAAATSSGTIKQAHYQAMF